MNRKRRHRQEDHGEQDREASAAVVALARLLGRAAARRDIADSGANEDDRHEEAEPGS
jgi:hypothetical protein